MKKKNNNNKRDVGLDATFSAHVPLYLDVNLSKRRVVQHTRPCITSDSLPSRAAVPRWRMLRNTQASKQASKPASKRTRPCRVLPQVAAALYAMRMNLVYAV